jgi:hypothetical protein
MSLLEARQVASRKLGRPFDNRTPRQVIDDYRAAGQIAVPVLPIARLFVDTNQPLKLMAQQIIPLSGISKALTVYGNENGDYLVYKSDEFGFTNPPGIFHLESCDVVVLGDSYAHGACVPVGKDSVSLLRHQIPATLNLGYMAAGPLSYLGTLTEYGLSRRPRIVLWYHFEGNDLKNLFLEGQTLLSRYLEDDFQQGLSDLQAEIDRGLFAIGEEHLKLPDPPQHFLWRAATLQALRRQVLSICRLRNSQPDADLDYFQLVLRTAKERVEQTGGQLKLVYLPAYERYTGQIDLYRRQEEGVSMAMSELGVPVINVARVFAKHPDPLSLFPFRLNGHYTEEGYGLVAQTILEELNSLPATKH